MQVIDVTQNESLCYRSCDKGVPHFEIVSNLFSHKNRGEAKREARRDMTKPNLVSRVLRLFGQREFARGSREIGQNRERCLICEDIQHQ